VGKGTIYFFEEGIKFIFPDKRVTKNWINEIARTERKKVRNINFIFCSDVYLHDLNVKYLNHDTFTDVITFDLADNPDELCGDIFISIDRIKDNSKTFENSFRIELNRVISHGILHLIGYNDKTKDEILIIRKKEDYYLSLLPNLIR
jgi:rRNA maturation RNase YbeY